jgi:hypothetical protein
MRVVKVMFFEGESSETVLVPSIPVLLIFMALAIPSVVFGMYWTPIANWVSQSLIFFTQVI